jgi:hypothetical protein
VQDPHVVAVHYSVAADKTVTYENPPPIDWVTATFDMHLADGSAVFSMKEHYPSEALARHQIDKLLREWDLWIQLTRGAPAIRFVFERSEIVDRDPPPPPKPGEIRGSAMITLAGISIAGTGTVHVTLHRYPEPPRNFRVSPLVEDLWSLYDRYRQDRERLLPMAYSFFNLLLWEVGGDLQEAAHYFNVSRNVLERIRVLSSSRGDRLSARKIARGSSLEPLTPSEIHWLEAVLKAVIQRVGELAAAPDSQLVELTMASFPPVLKSPPRPSGADGCP